MRQRVIRSKSLLTGLQETRTAYGFRSANTYVTYASWWKERVDTHSVESRVARPVVYSKSGRQDLFLEGRRINVIHRDPRFMFVAIAAPLLQQRVALSHVPSDRLGILLLWIFICSWTKSCAGGHVQGDLLYS